MHISYYTHMAGLETSTGFGYAGFNIVTALQALGHTVTFDDPDAPVQLEFTQPNDYTKREGQLAIGYTPWESTQLKPEWIKDMNVPDLRWCTSELNKQWFEDLGYQVDGVFHHGITHNWTPRRRKLPLQPRQPSNAASPLRRGGATLPARPRSPQRLNQDLVRRTCSASVARSWRKAISYLACSAASLTCAACSSSASRLPPETDSRSSSAAGDQFS